MTNLSIVYTLICLSSINLFIDEVRAEMFVDRSIVVFEKDAQPRVDVKVSNSGDENIYVQVDVLEVRNAGQVDELRTKITDPTKMKLIATPNKLIIPPNGQKLVRILNLQTANNEERIYRINVTPIVAPLEDETGQLRIVVAYQILTIIQPDSPDSVLQANRTGKSINFKNSGNTNVLLFDGRQCNPADGEQCEELTSRRLYAGNSWTLDLPFDAPVSFSVRGFDGIKSQVFP